MQDEITKHTKKVYDEFKNPKHTFGEKAREIVIEIFIIVFAVTLSISLHSWSENRHEQKEAYRFLSGLQNDLNEDIKKLEENKNLTSKLDSNYAFLLGINTNQPDDDQLSAKIHKRLVYNLLTTRLNTGRYDGFKSSGKIETIENDSLKENILVFYQQTINNVTDLEDFLNSWQLKILNWDVDKDGKLPIKAFVTTEKMKGLLSLGAENFKVNINNYNEAIKQAREIVAEIDREKTK